MQERNSELWLLNLRSITSPSVFGECLHIRGPRRGRPRSVHLRRCNIHNLRLNKRLEINRFLPLLNRSFIVKLHGDSVQTRFFRQQEFTQDEAIFPKAFCPAFCSDSSSSTQASMEITACLKLVCVEAVSASMQNCSAALRSFPSFFPSM